MKKIMFGAVVLLLVAAAAFYLLSGAGDLIKTQIEQQGTKYLQSEVSVGSVELSYTEGKLVIRDFAVKNPQGFSDQNAFAIAAIVVDIGGATSEPYVIDQVAIDAAQLLYEMDSGGKANLIALKENLESMLPVSGEPAPEPAASGQTPLVMVNDVSVSNTRLALDFEQLSTGKLELDKKVYAMTLPTFSAGAIGKPNGIPADQVGAAIAQAMLDNAIAQAKQEGKDLLTDKAKEKFAEKKDELLEKGKDKLKDFLKKKK